MYCFLIYWGGAWPLPAPSQFRHSDSFRPNSSVRQAPYAACPDKAQRGVMLLAVAEDYSAHTADGYCSACVKSLFLREAFVLSLKLNSHQDAWCLHQLGLV